MLNLAADLNGMEAYLSALEVLPREYDRHTFSRMPALVACMRHGDFKKARTLSETSHWGTGSTNLLEAVKLLLLRKYSEVVVQCRHNLSRGETSSSPSSSSSSSTNTPISSIFLLSEAYAKSGMPDKAMSAAKLCCDLAQERIMAGDGNDGARHELGLQVPTLMCLASLCLALRMREVGRNADAKACFAKHSFLCRRSDMPSDLVETMAILYQSSQFNNNNNNNTSRNSQPFDAAAALRHVRRLAEVEESVLQYMLAHKFEPLPKQDITNHINGKGGKPRQALHASESMGVTMDKPSAKSMFANNGKEKGKTKSISSMTNTGTQDKNKSDAGPADKVIMVSLKPTTATMHSTAPSSSSSFPQRANPLVSRGELESNMRISVESLQSAKFQRHRTHGFDRKHAKDGLVSQIQAILRGACARTRHGQVNAQKKRLASLHLKMAKIERKEQSQREILKSCAHELERRGIFTD